MKTTLNIIGLCLLCLSSILCNYYVYGQPYTFTILRYVPIYVWVMFVLGGCLFVYGNIKEK